MTLPRCTLENVGVSVTLDVQKTRGSSRTPSCTAVYISPGQGHWWGRRFWRVGLTDAVSTQSWSPCAAALQSCSLRPERFRHSRARLSYHTVKHAPHRSTLGLQRRLTGGRSAATQRRTSRRLRPGIRGARWTSPQRSCRPSCSFSRYCQCSSRIYSWVSWLALTLRAPRSPATSMGERGRQDHGESDQGYTAGGEGQVASGEGRGVRGEEV